jgi:protein-tyrosine phosphatase
MPLHLTTRPHLLVICGKNKRRSRTAEQLYRQDARVHIRSAGLSPKSERKLTANDLLWADVVLVMDHAQRARIRETYRHLALPPIEVLHIPDVYGYMDEALVALLTDKLEAVIQNML